MVYPSMRNLTRANSSPSLGRSRRNTAQQMQSSTLSEQIEAVQSQVLNEEWVISIQERLSQALRDHCPLSLGAKPCIFRVPHYLREMDQKAYLPQVVSLGPYHRREGRLREMDRHKWRAVQRAVERTGHGIRAYLHVVKELEEKARACYEGQIGLNNDDFAEMLLLDGCFILEILRGASLDGGFKDLGYAPNDSVFAMGGLMHSIRRDMIMLENQLPLFVLGRLLNLQEPDGEDADGTDRVVKLAARFLEPLMPTDRSKPKDLHRQPSSHTHHNGCVHNHNMEKLHCLDVFRRTLFPIPPKTNEQIKSRKRRDERRHELVHCVTELKEAGITFRRRKSGMFLDVKFNHGVLKIPKLLIHDDTKSIFLNLVAFEQCHREAGNHITSYVIFMDNLIDSAEDVGYLQEKGIIEHWLGSNAQVADLFNKLCQGVVFEVDNSYLSHLLEDINGYYNKKWNTWRASLKHKYFHNPWAIISLFAAVVLLALTFSQSFYAVYAYYRPPSKIKKK